MRNENREQNASNSFFVAYAECDKKTVEVAINAISHRLLIDYEIWDYGEINKEKGFIESPLSRKLEQSEFVLLLFSKEGSQDSFLNEQYKLAINLNKRILPLILDESSINTGFLRVKNPFSFRVDVLDYNDEADRIKLIEQLHSWLGLTKIGDIYGSSITIISDTDCIIKRGDESLIEVAAKTPTNIILAKGTGFLSFFSIGGNDGDWAEYNYLIKDNDSAIEFSPCLRDVSKVRRTKIADLMFNPNNEDERNWDLKHDTSIFHLNKTSQEFKKKDISKASFYREYIEHLLPQPDLKFTSYWMLPEKWVIWISALIGLILVIFSEEYFFIGLLKGVGIWIVYRIIRGIIRFAVNKYDEISNDRRINKVVSYNEKLYIKVNSAQIKFFAERQWGNTALKHIKGSYPKNPLTFDFSSLPDNSLRYNEKSESYSTASNYTFEQHKKSVRVLPLMLIIACLAGSAVLMLYIGTLIDNLDDDGPKCKVENLADGSKTFRFLDLEIRLIKVNGGLFTMGGNSKDLWDYEKPGHDVSLASFYIGETEVTQNLWTSVMGNNPSIHVGDSLPVENVSWNDCQEFITKLNEITGQNFRFPTEAEWEYSAKGGKNKNQYTFSGSEDIKEVAWYATNSGKESHPVKTLAPNSLGIYDMSGNVWEWCSDYHEFYPKSKDVQYNPHGPISGANKVLRGGGFENSRKMCRLTIRAGGNPDDKICTLGLRLAMSAY